MSPHWLHACYEQEKWIPEEEFSSNFNPSLRLLSIRYDHSPLVAIQEDPTGVPDVPAQPVRFPVSSVKKADSAPMLSPTISHIVDCQPSLPVKSGETENVEILAPNSLEPSPTSSLKLVSTSDPSTSSNILSSPKPVSKYGTQAALSELQKLLETVDEPTTVSFAAKLKERRSNSHDTSVHAAAPVYIRRSDLQQDSSPADKGDSQQSQAMVVSFCNKRVLEEQERGRILKNLNSRRVSANGTVLHGSLDQVFLDSMHVSEPVVEGPTTPRNKQSGNRLTKSTSASPLSAVKTPNKRRRLSLARAATTQLRPTCSRDNTEYIFSFMGYNSAEQFTLESQVKRLGGTCSHAITNRTTHIVAARLERCTQFFQCLAGGIVLLQPAYISDSIQEGQFLDPQPYEYSSSSCSPSEYQLTEAYETSRARERNLTENYGTGTKVFSRVKAIVYVTAGKVKTYRDILTIGGATVVGHSPPFKTDGVTHAFVDAIVQCADKRSLELLREANIPCISAQTIMNHLLHKTSIM